MNFYTTYTVMFGIVAFANAMLGLREFDRGAPGWGAIYVVFGIVALLVSCAAWKLHWMHEERKEEK